MVYLVFISLFIFTCVDQLRYVFRWGVDVREKSCTRLYIGPTNVHYSRDDFIKTDTATRSNNDCSSSDFDIIFIIFIFLNARILSSW